MVKSELDFFSMEKGSKPPIQRRRSFRYIQLGVISKMNPEVVKSIIENKSVSCTPKRAQTYSSSPMPRHHPKLRLRRGSENNAEITRSAPMTIFYKGRVLVYDVSPHQAQDILNVAEEIFPKFVDKNGDFPILRTNSLQRFLENRKQRLTTGPSHLK